MTSRQRLLSAIKGEKTDRVPWAPEINQHFAEMHLRKAGLENAPHPYVTINKLIGGDALCSFLPYKTIYQGGIKHRVETHGDETYEIFETPRGELVAKFREEPVAKTRFRYEPFIKGPKDYPAYRYLTENTKYIPDYDGLLEEIRKVGEDGLVTLTAPPTPLMGFIMDHMGAEATIYQLYDHEREMVELMEVIHEKNKEAYRICAQAPAGEMVRPFEDTSSSLTSPAMFEKYCLPHLKDYAAIIHQGNKLFVPHMCGHLKDMLPFLKDAGIDGIEAVTPPPTGNCTAKMVREVMGDKCIIIGGLDPTLFSTVTPKKIEGIVNAVLDSMHGDRRFILGNEEISAAAKMENVLAVSRIIRNRRLRHK